VLRQAGEVGSDASLLLGIWPDHIDRDEAETALATIAEGREWLLRWRSEGFTESKADG